MNKHQFAHDVFDLLCQWIPVGDLRVTWVKDRKHASIEWTVKVNGELWQQEYGISDYESEFSESAEGFSKRIFDQFRHKAKIQFGADVMDCFDPAAPTTPQNH